MQGSESASTATMRAGQAQRTEHEGFDRGSEPWSSRHSIPDHIGHVHSTTVGVGSRFESTLGAALIRGDSPAAASRAAGINVANHYLVVSLSISSRAWPDRKAAVRRTGLVVDVVRALCGSDAIPMVGAHGGTILVPARSEDDTCPNFVTQLASAVSATVTAVVVSTTTTQIPRAAALTDELLDLVHRLRYPPRMYRFDELALEYQLTLPGDANDCLHRMLMPLLPHPDLVETLTCHRDNGFRRKVTARLLGVHINTIDYRLRRVKELTGLDPTSPLGSWQLQSAMIIHLFRSADSDVLTS